MTNNRKTECGIDRRRFLGTVGVGSLGAIAGCSVNFTGDGFDVAIDDTGGSGNGSDGNGSAGSSDGTATPDEQNEIDFSQYRDGTGTGEPGAWVSGERDGVSVIVGPAENGQLPAMSQPVDLKALDPALIANLTKSPQINEDALAGGIDLSGVTLNNSTDEQNGLRRGLLSQLFGPTASSVTAPITSRVRSRPGVLADVDCQSRQTTITAGGTEQLLLNPTQRIFYPGAIIDATTIPSGQYQFVNAPRAPVLLTTNIPAAKLKGRSYRAVKNPSLATIREAKNSIERSVTTTGATVADMAYHAEQIFSEQQTKVSLGAHYENAVADVTAKFDFSDQSTETKILVKFVQKYYDISVDWQNKAFFSDGRTPSPNDVLVSNVSYGRILLFSVESSEDVMTLKTAVDAAFSSLTQSGSASVDASYDEVLKRAETDVTIIGGSATAASQVIKGGFSGIKDFIAAGANFGPNNPAAPIAYQLTYLSDLSNAGVLLSTEYTQRTCREIVDTFRVHNFRIRLDSHSDSGSQAEIFGNLRVYAYGEWGDGSSQVSRRVYARGRNGVTVWSRGESEAIDLSTGGVHTPNIDETIIFPDGKNLNRGQTAETYLVVGGHLWEEDTGGDDDLGYSGQRIYLDEIVSTGEHELKFGGDAEITVSFTVSPVSG